MVIGKCFVSPRFHSCERLISDTNFLHFQNLKVKRFSVAHENKVYPISLMEQSYDFNTTDKDKAYGSRAGFAHLMSLLGETCQQLYIVDKRSCCNVVVLAGFYRNKTASTDYDLEAFLKGDTVFGANLSGFPSNESFSPPISSGNSTVQVEFQDPLSTTEKMVMFAIALYTDRVMITKDLVVSTSYIAGAY